MPNFETIHQTLIINLFLAALLGTALCDIFLNMIRKSLKQLLYFHMDVLHTLFAVAPLSIPKGHCDFSEVKVTELSTIPLIMLFNSFYFVIFLFIFYT